MTRKVFANGDVLYAEDVNAIADPILDGQDYIGHGPQVIDTYLSDDPTQLKTKWYSFYNRFQVSIQSGLTLSYLGGNILISTGIVSITAGTITVPNNATSYVYISNTGAVSQASSLPNECFPLALVVTASGAVTTLSDLRNKIIDRVTPASIPTVVLVPTGTITGFASTTAPSGWLNCDGSIYSNTTYPALFALLGYSYGGNGTSTFAVPNMNGRVAVGAGSGAGLSARSIGQTGGEENTTLNTSQIPSHNHAINDPGHNHGLVDSGHNHSVIDPGHSHSTYDPGHNHGLNLAMGGNNGSDIGYVATNNDGQNHGNQIDFINHQPTDTSYTGLNINGSGTGVYLRPSNAGVSLQAASTGITTSAQGGNGSHNTMQPFLVINYIIKY